MRLGIIARADRGGLAAMTYEAWRHLQPERVLIVDLGLAARGGKTHPERYDAPWSTTFTTKYHHSGFEIEHFIAGLDVVYAAESVYEDHVYTLARAHRCATVLHVMPELCAPVDRQATALWAPTDWELARLPKRTEVVPMPVALDRFDYRRRTRCETLFATTGEAMCDRNGWEIVREAMLHVERPLRLLWRGPLEWDPNPEQLGKVTMQWLPPVDYYEQVIPAEVDLMLMPRRYGGQCLPVQEAAAAGIPSVMTAVSPQSGWFAPDLLIPAVPERKVKMKGGEFTVYGADPYRLAATINLLAASPDRMSQASVEARRWAERIGWDIQLDAWRERLDHLAHRR